MLSFCHAGTKHHAFTFRIPLDLLTGMNSDSDTLRRWQSGCCMFLVYDDRGDVFTPSKIVWAQERARAGTWTCKCQMLHVTCLDLRLKTGVRAPGPTSS